MILLEHRAAVCYSCKAKQTDALQRCNFVRDSFVAGASMMHRAREVTTASSLATGLWSPLFLIWAMTRCFAKQCHDEPCH